MSFIRFILSYLIFYAIVHFLSVIFQLVVSGDLLYGWDH